VAVSFIGGVAGEKSLASLITIIFIIVLAFKYFDFEYTKGRLFQIETRGAQPCNCKLQLAESENTRENEKWRLHDSRCCQD
jgi:hypothetical protein